MILTQIVCMLLGSVLVVVGITVHLLLIIADGLFTNGIIPFAIVTLGILVLLGGLFE